MLAALRPTANPFVLERIAFTQQLNFIQDPSRLKALFCTRRAAKSFTAGIYLISEALKTPGCNCLFIGLTRLSAHGIIWKDILKEIDLKFKLGIKFNETLLTATLPNGSVIYVAGADSDESEMNKLLGKKYRLVTLDEASMFSVNMHQLVYGILKPATADQRGTICLLGTSSNITRGLFYDITTKIEPGWSLHEWSAYDNPHVAEQWREEIEEIKRSRPKFMDTALFKQWMLNQWVISEDALVYKFKEGLNEASSLPKFQAKWSYVLGIDLGFHPDPSAFVVGAYNPESPHLYIVHCEKHLKMDVTDVANKIKALEHTYQFEAKVVDGSMKMAVEEMNTRHGVNVIPADKSGKEHWINFFNAEFIQGNIKLLPQTKALKDELMTLVWISDNGLVKIPRKEHPSIANHLSDGLLYLLRYTHSYLFKPKPNIVDFSSQDHWEPQHIKRMEEEVRKQLNPTSLDLESDPELFNFDLDDGI